MPKALIGAWCWDGNNTRPPAYHRCKMMSGGEDVEFKPHGFEGEATVSGAGACHLMRVERQPVRYQLDFECGNRGNRQLVSDPVSGHISIDEVPRSKKACVVADPTGTPLNVRNRPNGPILGALANDNQVFITDVTEVGGRKWAKVVPLGEGKTGWVFQDYLTCD